jgi:hypothetical protein
MNRRESLSEIGGEVHRLPERIAFFMGPSISGKGPRKQDFPQKIQKYSIIFRN